VSDSLDDPVLDDPLGDPLDIALDNLAPDRSPPLIPDLLAATIHLKPGEIPRISPAALAYLGDAVYELYVRQTYLMPPQRPDAYHRQVVAQVRAESQANHLAALDPQLTDAERAVVKRGRNASPKSKRADPGAYQKATGFEALVGYLYLTDPDRLQTLLSRLGLGGWVQLDGVQPTKGHRSSPS
jgi:ribonuclease III family protein